MSIEAMKQALEALEANEKLINGEEDCFGLEGAMDGYYSGCFDVDGVNKLTDQAITSLRQAIAEAEKQEPVACGYDETTGNCTQNPCCYTHPQPKREWVELTKEEYDEIYASNKDKVYEAMMVVATYLKRKNNAD